MNYHDPTRPRISYKPAYLSLLGKPIAPLPQLSVWPLECNPTIADGKRQEVMVGMWLLNGPNSAQLHSIQVDLRELGAVVLEYQHDPETFFRHRFGYDYEPNARPLRFGPQPQFTLQDLGLAT